MNQLSEYSIRYMYSLDNSKRMIYTVDFVVQVLEVKQDKKNFMFLTISDGINFCRNFLINKRNELNFYDVIRIENILRSSPQDQNQLIFISRSVVLSNSQKVIRNPIQFPIDKSGKEIRFLDNEMKKEEKKVEKKIIIKVQKITLKPKNENYETRRENNNSQTLNESKIIKENITCNSLILNENETHSKIEKVLTNSNTNNLNDIIQKTSKNSSNKKKNENNSQDLSQEIYIDLDKFFEINENTQIEQSKAMVTPKKKNSTESDNVKFSQDKEIRLTQEINQSEIIKQIEEINRIEEEKIKNTSGIETNNKRDYKLEIDKMKENIKRHEEFNDFDEISPSLLLEQIEDFLDLPDAGTNPTNEVKPNTDKNNIYKQSDFLSSRSQSEKHFRLTIPWRPMLRSLHTKLPYQRLEELKDGMTNFTIRFRIIKNFKIVRPQWYIRIIDDKENIGQITVTNNFINQYKNILKIYDIFEITYGLVKKQKLYKPDVDSFTSIHITNETVVSKIRENESNFKIIEEDYIPLSKLKVSKSNNFSILAFVYNVDEQRPFISRKGLEGKLFSFYLIDQSKYRVHFNIYNEVPKLEIKEGDIIYISNPTVEATTFGTELKANIYTLIYVNPNCPTALKLRINFKSALIESVISANHYTYKSKFTKIRIKELEELCRNNDNYPDEIYIIKATIINFVHYNSQFYEACPFCNCKLKIDIHDYFCGKCNTKRKETSTSLMFNFSINDCTGACRVFMNHYTSVKLLSYMSKKIKSKEITPEGYKRLFQDYREGKYVKEFEEISSFLFYSEYYFRVKVSRSNKDNISEIPTPCSNGKKNANNYDYTNNTNINKSKKMLGKRNTMINCQDFWAIEKKKERESAVKTIKQVLGLK
jgi:hypothetical protein